MSMGDIYRGEPAFDEELQRIATIQGVLDPLSQIAIERILKYLLARYQADGEAK